MQGPHYHQRHLSSVEYFEYVLVCLRSSCYKYPVCQRVRKTRENRLIFIIHCDIVIVFLFPFFVSFVKEILTVVIHLLISSVVDPSSRWLLIQDMWIYRSRCLNIVYSLKLSNCSINDTLLLTPLIWIFQFSYLTTIVKNNFFLHYSMLCKLN